MKWIGLTATGFIFALAIWFGGQYFYEKAQPADIRLVVTSWPTGQLMYAVKQLGYFSKHGVRVEIMDARDQYSEAVNKLSRGEADAGVLVLSEPLLLTLTGKPMEVVLGLDYSAGADGLVVSQEIKDLADLENKTIAYQPGSFGDLLLQQALTTVGLEESDVITRSLSQAEASRAFLLGEVDAAVTVEPFLSQALVRNGSSVLFSSAESPGLLTDVVTFDADFETNHGGDVTRFVDAWLDFKRDIDTDPHIKSQAYSIVAIRLGETYDTVVDEFAGIHILSEEEIVSAFSRESSTVSLFQSGQTFLNFFNNRMGLDTSMVDLGKVLNNQYVVNN